MQAETGYCPVRTYYCLFCDGWHVTSINAKFNVYKNEQLLEQFQKDKERQAQLKSEAKSLNKKRVETEIQPLRDIKIDEVESIIKEMEPLKKKWFFRQQIRNLLEEIKTLPVTYSKEEQKRIKSLRKDLHTLFIVRKLGCQV